LSRLLKILLLALLMMVPFLGGCIKASPPEGTAQTAPPPTTTWPKQGSRPSGILGLPTPVALTLEDKAVITLIAQGSWYQVELASFQWYAIIWADSAVPATVWAVDEQTAAVCLPSYINPNALWYPGVVVTHSAGGTTYQKQVAVDYDSYRVVYSVGPYVSPGTPPPMIVR